jgi:molybdopterin-containing oxidoreductase family membrane subunit
VYLFLDGRRDAAIMARFPGRLQWYHRWWASGYQDTPEEKARHRTSTLWLALAIVPLLIVAHSTLGFVFGLQVGRPGWYGTLQAPAFVALAGVSGVGNLIILAALVRRIFRKWNGDRIAIDAFAWMGKSLMALLAVYLYFMAVELLTLVYATPEAEKQLSDALLRGEYAWIYWGSVAALFLPMIAIAYQTLKKKWSVGLLVAVGVLVNLGAIGKRYLIVVPSQTHGELLPYEIGSYSPTWTEYAVVLGLFALGALLIGLFMKAFPILPIEEGKEVGADA